MKLYSVLRRVDIPGASGTAVVAHAVEFADGTTVVKVEGGILVYRSLAKAVDAYNHFGDATFELVGEYEGAGHSHRHEHGRGHRGAAIYESITEYFGVPKRVTEKNP